MEYNTTEHFELQTTNSDEVLKVIKILLNNCLTGHDNNHISDKTSS